MSTIRREVVPFMADAKDALSLCKRKKDDFYLSAFKIECWLGTLAETTAVQYAREKLGKCRKLQVGEAGRIFGELFRDTSGRDFSALFAHLARFAQAEGPYSFAVSQAFGAMYREGDSRELSRLLSRKDIGGIWLQRKFVNRLCDWLDAITHWRVHERYYASPLSFDVDADQRELATIGGSKDTFLSSTQVVRSIGTGITN
jgi:hypothetical protein